MNEAAEEKTLGPWRLVKEDYEAFWVHPIKTTRFTKRKKIGGTLDKKSQYLIFAWTRRWYHTETREFETTEEVIRSFDDVIADGTKAIYDWRNRTYVYADGALD